MVTVHLHCLACLAADAARRPPDGLRKYFTEFGEVEDCTILRDQDGRSRGFAFLTFKDPSSVNAVMCREHVLDGKTVRACLLPSFLDLS